MNTEDIAAFPLCWPQGWPRSSERIIYSRFKVNSVYEAIEHLLPQLERMGAEGVVISTSVPLRRDGLPMSRPPVDGDVGAAIYFTRKGKNLCLACDQYTRVCDNLHALAKIVEVIRGIERRGSTDLLDRVFTGFAALPARKQWYEVLGLEATATDAAVNKRYKQLALEHHPDRPTGTEEKWTELDQAMQDYADAAA